ncbi:hypothetical protein J4212_00340 [Candidatus Woesearchaeota archaeon]|nr:hypothetical protein [Candidatus Woesearchaeota archaeon]
MTPNKLIPGIALILLFIAGCASVSKEEAESMAIEVVQENVQFFSRDGNSTENLGAFKVESMESVKEGSDWIVFMHVSAEKDGEKKSNDITMRFNRKGQLTEFNGKKVPVTG